MGLQHDVHVEINRCQLAIEQGSPADFWVNRLDAWATRLETAAKKLRDQIAWVRKPREARDISGFRFGGKLVEWNVADNAFTYDFGRERVAVVKEDRGWRWHLETPSMIYSSDPFEKPLHCIQELCAKRKERLI